MSSSDKELGVLTDKEKRLFELFKEERIKRLHYKHELRVTREELRQLRTNYAALSLAKGKK